MQEHTMDVNKMTDTPSYLQHCHFSQAPDTVPSSCKPTSTELQTPIACPELQSILCGTNQIPASNPVGLSAQAQTKQTLPTETCVKAVLNCKGQIQIQISKTIKVKEECRPVTNNHVHGYPGLQTRNPLFALDLNFKNTQNPVNLGGVGSTPISQDKAPQNEKENFPAKFEQIIQQPSQGKRKRKRRASSPGSSSSSSSCSSVCDNDLQDLCSLSLNPLQKRALPDFTQEIDLSVAMAIAEMECTDEKVEARQRSIRQKLCRGGVIMLTRLEEYDIHTRAENYAATIEADSTFCFVHTDRTHRSSSYLVNGATYMSYNDCLAEKRKRKPVFQSYKHGDYYVMHTQGSKYDQQEGVILPQG